MNSKLFIFIFISLAVGVVSYIALENIFIPIAVFGLYLVSTIFVVIPRLNKYELTKTRYHECYHFINNFVNNYFFINWSFPEDRFSIENYEKKKV